jgi:hypothetical protein
MSRESFLSAFQSPHKTWASDAAEADVATPTDERVGGGWAANERPTHRMFNFIHKRVDDRLVDLEARLAFLENFLGITGEANGVVNAPVITSPGDGSEIPSSGVLTATSGPMVISGTATDTHASSDWKITTDPEGAFIVAAAEASLDLVSHAFTGLNLASGQAYYIWARHNGLALGYGPWARISVYTAA